ncbi:MAG: ACP S-malonyltransferase [Paracoccaceae bacterium]|nr:ACP S-malonyltransferase [Paracoccaceae bacterium]MDE2674685.1 ACP S-malonyltransferase [Paracoccaceae bacterium]MDE2738417.1 ACP S-malonyltransferase [Paracoccaceae bacterium]MXZ50535.1 ACP S-malonyltransferase [Paracoccaceae bacterium]MYF45626.1 ACP S-malonyltransferase [Paracoccaceae bacterium]
MKSALLFPGQGSQVIGMGKDLAENYSTSKQVFDIVDEALGEKLSDLIWQGDIEELTLTRNVQPALMAASVAAYRALLAEGFSVTSIAYMAGHSLGEYSALCAAGAISLEDTARLLRLRGEAMQEAVKIGEGKMAAILGLEINAVKEIAELASDLGVCDIANDNDPKQIVVSGSIEAVNRAMEIATEKGARRVVELTVSAPFHCQLMNPAAERMKEALENTEIRNPSVPIIANVTAEPVINSDEIRSNLVKQVTATVRWHESINHLSQKQITNAFELGSGNVLTGLVRRIDRNIKCFPICNSQQVKSALERME